MKTNTNKSRTQLKTKPLGTRLKEAKIKDNKDKRMVQKPGVKAHFVIAPDMTTDFATTECKVDVDFDSNAFQLPFISFYSHLCSNSSILNLANSTGQTNVFQTVADAVAYLYQESQTFMQAGTLSPNKVPMVFREILAALTPKTVHTRTRTSVAYSWGTPGFQNLPTVNYGGYEWLFIQPLDDNSAYDSLCVVVVAVPTLDAYSKVLGLLESSTYKYLKPVDNIQADSPLKSSVSAFSRNYVYNGLQPVSKGAGGYYKDVELEVPIFHPRIAQFAQYGTDTRAPKFLTVSSGDGAQTYGLPMHQGWGGYSNHGHVEYKFIDFENIYDTLCLWASFAKTAMANQPSSVGGNQFLNTFAFTQQDFRIVLRQAIMGMLNENYWTQFMGPLAADGGNYFQPFYVTGNTYSSPAFAQFQLPQLIKENLAALRTRILKLGKGNTIVMVPVLGRYVEDTPTQYTVALPDPTGTIIPGTVYVDLFTPLPQANIDLVDGSSSNGYVNLNGLYYYNNVMTNWNLFCGAAQQVTAGITTILGDKGPPGLPALSMTRVVKDVNQTFYFKAIDLDTLRPDPRFVRKDSKGKVVINNPPVKPALKSRLHKIIKNYQSDKTTDGVLALPPSTASQLTVQTVLSVTRFGPEAYGMFQNLILPTIRFDPNNTQVLNQCKYQTETNEFVSYQMVNSGAGASGPNGNATELSNFAVLAGWCITGIAGQTSEYANIIKLLSDQNHAGFLASLLGGFAKSILPPEVGGIVDAISEIVPI